MNSLLENIYLKKTNFGKFAKTYQMKDYEKKEMNLASNNEWENIYILPDMPNLV